MSERQYFSLRYVIPGFSLILTVLAINHFPLFRFLALTQAGETFGAFLAFLSLFAGSAIGFLISQFWWWRIHNHTFFEREEVKKVTKEIYIKFLKRGNETEEEIANKTKDKDTIRKIGNIWEWIIREEKQDKFFKLATSRWDTFNLLSSTKLALIIGVAVGIVYRVYFYLFFPHFGFFSVAETFSLLILLTGWASLFAVIWNSPKRLLTGYSSLMLAFVLNSAVENLGKGFQYLISGKETKGDSSQ